MGTVCLSVLITKSWYYNCHNLTAQEIIIRNTLYLTMMSRVCFKKNVIWAWLDVWTRNYPYLSFLLWNLYQNVLSIFVGRECQDVCRLCQPINNYFYYTLMLSQWDFPVYFPIFHTVLTSSSAALLQTTVASISSRM